LTLYVQGELAGRAEDAVAMEEMKSELN